MGFFRGVVRRLQSTVLASHWTDKIALHRRWLFFVFFYAVLTNVPSWAATRWLSLLPLGWFCLEYAAVGVLALYAPRILTAGLLLLVILVDVATAVSKTYYLSPTECLANVSSLGEFSGMRLLSIAAVGFLTLLVASTAAFFPVSAMRRRSRQNATACLIAFAALCISADCVRLIRERGRIQNPFKLGSVKDVKALGAFNRRWMSRYPMVRLVREEKLLIRPRDTAGSSRGNFFPVRSATALAVHLAGLDAGKRSREMPNLIIVLVESWGFDMDQTVRDSLVQPFSGPGVRARYSVVEGTVPFYGGTVAGEARELCGNSFGFHLMYASTAELHGCLPDYLAGMGYRTIAMHGLSGNMFVRSQWYGTIGFQEQWFNDRFKLAGLPDCLGAFVGTCDAAIAEMIGHRLEEGDSEPNFIHWVTLISHLPLPVPTPLSAPASCSMVPSLSRQPALCSWYQLVFNVQDAVSLIALAKTARPTIFVIVGDHAPPFSDPALRSQFSNADVPYVLLLPRAVSQNPTQIPGDTNFIPERAVAARVASGTPNPACQLQYGHGVAHSTPAVCP